MGLLDLFKPAWQSDNEEKAIASVQKITDKGTLKKIAIKANYGSVRKAAEEQLDQSILADFAKNNSDADVRMVAVEKLTNQSILVDIAKNDSHSDVRKAAAERLTDQSILADIAKNDSDSSVHKEAMEKLTDQSTLTEEV